MKRWAAVAATVVLALAGGGCGLLIPGQEPEFVPAGPRFELGPIPVFGDGGDGGAGGSLVFFETRDGWCTEQAGGRGCAGGGGLPRGFTGLGGTRGGDETCVEAVTGKEVVRVEVRPGDLEPVTLRPLPGGEAAPVNVFAACWVPGMPLDDIAAEGFDAGGQRVGASG